MWSTGGRFTCQISAEISTPIPTPCRCGDRNTRVILSNIYGSKEFTPLVYNFTFITNIPNIIIYLLNRKKSQSLLLVFIYLTSFITKNSFIFCLPNVLKGNVTFLIIWDIKFVVY